MIPTMSGNTFKIENSKRIEFIFENKFWLKFKILIVD